MAQIILEDLPLKERMRYLERIRQNNREREEMVSNLQNGANKYEIIQDAHLMVLGKPITHTITKTEWQVSYQSDNRIEAEVVVLKEEQQSGGNWNELFHLMKKLTTPLQKINFELSEKGLIISILNKNEILNKWNEVKTEYINDNSFSEILKLGDADYSNPLPTIKKNIIYQLFFFSLYKNTYIMNKPNNVERDVLLQSVIFPECNFRVNVEEEAYERDSDYVFFNQYTVDKDIDLGKVKSLYKEKYKPFMKQNTGQDEGVEDYSISYKSNYKIFEEARKLTHCKAAFEEKVNRNLYYNSNIEIKLIN